VVFQSSPFDDLLMWHTASILVRSEVEKEHA